MSIKSHVENIQRNFQKHMEQFNVHKTVTSSPLPNANVSANTDAINTAINTGLGVGSHNYMRFYPPSQTTIINNNAGNGSNSGNGTQTSKKNEPLTTGRIVGAGIMLTGVAVAFTYFASSDPYITFLMSSIESDVQFIRKNRNLLTDQQRAQFNDFIDLYDQWKSSFGDQYKYMFYDKLVITGSSMTLITGALLSSMPVVAVGTIGVGVGSVYYAWKYFMGGKFGNQISTREQMYVAMTKSLDRFALDF